MKRQIALLIVMIMSLTLFAACNGSKETTEKETTTEQTTEKTETTETTESSEEVDAVTTASIVDSPDALVNGLSADGTWIVATLNDIEVADDIVVDGQFEHREAIDRKLALYTQDEERNITAQFTLTAPKLTVKSENFRITGGTFKGDVYVEAPGFKLDKASTVDGNIYFASKELLDTFVVSDTSAVTGTIAVDGVDVVTSASLVTDVDGLVNGLSADGTWIVATYFNMTSKSDIVVEGEFIHREAVARKLALYTQDADRNITASFTLTAPKMIVKSENFRIQGGTFKGDVYVEANGFNVVKGSVDGNIYYATQEYKDSAVIDENSTVTGAQEVQ